jgi:hypothetical protein
VEISRLQMEEPLGLQVLTLSWSPKINGRRKPSTLFTIYSLLLSTPTFYLSLYSYEINNKKYRYSTTDSLKLAQSTTSTGIDVFGTYNLNAFDWEISGNSKVQFQTTIKVYPQLPNVIVFGQVFTSGLYTSPLLHYLHYRYLILFPIFPNLF